MLHSEDPQERKSARDDANRLALSFKRADGKPALFEALQDLPVLDAQYPQSADDQFDVSSKSGTPAKSILPPDDCTLIAMLADAPGVRGAARNFSFSLLEKGIGGLSEWLSMWRDPDRTVQVKKLLEDFIGLPSHFRDCILGATRRLLERTSGNGAVQDEDRGKTQGRLSDTAGRTAACAEASQGGQPDSTSRAESKVGASARQHELKMSFNEAVLWHRNRLDDDALIDHVAVAALHALGVTKTRIDIATRAFAQVCNGACRCGQGRQPQDLPLPNGGFEKRGRAGRKR
jgi:hypothetical protein